MAHLRSRKSFTLVEMLLATVIIAIALCGILAAYVGCLGLLATSKNVSIATNAAQGLMEQIHAHISPANPASTIPFPQIANEWSDADPGYNHLTFTVNNMPANMGVVYVDDTNPELFQVTISICWLQKSRVFGEDKNLNGVLNAGGRSSSL